MRTEPINSATDSKLVQQVLQGDERAFRAFFSLYFPRLFRFALYRVGGDADTAEDVAQTTLTKAIDRLETYRGEAALFSWLCTICRHEISAVVKRAALVPVVLVEDDSSVRAAFESLIDPDGTPESALRSVELARQVKVTLDSLPVDYGDALEWKYIDGLSVVEIGNRLGRSRKAAESLLNRAREAFRDGFAALAGSAHDFELEQLR